MHWLVDLSPGSGECQVCPTEALANEEARRRPGSRVLGPFSAEAVQVLARIVSHVRDKGVELPWDLVNEAEDALHGIDLKKLTKGRVNPEAETQPVIYSDVEKRPAIDKSGPYTPFKNGGPLDDE
jgi:hypothetical protein